MGKSKKKKQKVADFQKVKLKVGKTKPVGTNVTNTAFRTSTINIGAQLESSNEPVNRKKLSLKDLLNQINHYNINIRHEALNGLRDLFQMHPNLLNSQLSVWLSKVLGKITDVDSSVRHALLLCLDHAFSELSEVEVSPFFKIIITHICCGLTHINENVQLDALDIVGVIIDRFPTSFIPFSKKILDHVIDLISKQGSKETGQMKNAKLPKGIPALVSRQLSGNVESQMVTFKVRTRILEQLFKIIEVFRQPSKESTVNEVNKENVIYVTKQQPVFIDLFKYGVTPTIEENIPLEMWLEFDEQNKMINDVGNTQNLILKIFPLILNIWVEFEPSKLSANLNDLQASRLLVPGIKVIIDILDILLDSQQKCDNTFHENVLFLFKSFSKELFTHFFPSFILPVQSKLSNKTIGTGNPDTVQKCSIDYNFLIAKIISSLLKQSLITEQKQKLNYMKDLISFISLSIALNNLITDEKKILQLLIIFDDVLQVMYVKEMKRDKEVDECVKIFGSILKVYKMACLSSPWRLPLFNFFSKYIIDEKLFNSLSQSNFLKDFTESVISDVPSWPSSSEGMITKSLEFIKIILVRNLIDGPTAENISNSLIKITSSSGLFKNLNESLQKKTIEILFHIDIPDLVLSNLIKLCQQGTINLVVKKYIISIIGYCTCQKEKGLPLEKYLSFLLSVIVGFSMDDLQKFNVECPNSVSWSILNIFPNEVVGVPVDYAIGQFDQLDGLDSALSILVPVASKLLIQFRKLPVTLVHSLLKLLGHFSIRMQASSDVDHFGSEINQIVDLLSAVLLFSSSSSYKSVSRKGFNRTNIEFELLENELKIIAVNLLCWNRQLLKLLLEKWINVLGEYKMNAVCVNSIIEVLVELLKDPKLLPYLSAFKMGLQSIVTPFHSVNMPHIQQSLVDQLNMQITLL